MYNKGNNCDIDFKKIRYTFLISYISIILSSISIIPIVFIPDDFQGFSIVALFSMMGVIVFGVISLLLCHSISYIRKENQTKKNQKFEQTVNQIFTLHFFTNKTAVVYDVLLILSFTCESLTQIDFASNTISILMQSQEFSIFAVTVFIISLESHFLFNSKNYNFYLQLKRRTMH
jgi:hypothetical protein